MEQREIEEKLGSGHIQAHATLEIMGNPREHVEKTMQLVLERLKEEKGVSVVSSDVHEAQEQKEQKMFSTFAEVELLFKDFETLTRICFDYMPSSMEVSKPESFKLPALEVSNFVGDMLASLHQIDYRLKDRNAANRLLERNTANLLKNFVLFSLSSGKKSGRRLSEIIGIKQEQLEPFLAAFTQENLIRKNGDLWEKA